MLREQLDQASAINKELTESLWKASEDAELCDTRLRREQEVRKPQNEVLESERQQRKLMFIPFCK